MCSARLRARYVDAVESVRSDVQVSLDERRALLSAAERVGTAMADQLTNRRHGWLVFNEGPERWQIPDPEDGPRSDAAHTARYNLKNLTQTQAYQLAEVWDAYHVLMTHPWGTGGAIEKVRAIRRALLESTTEPRKGVTDA